MYSTTLSRGPLSTVRRRWPSTEWLNCLHWRGHHTCSFLISAGATTRFTDAVQKNTPNEGTRSFIKADFPASQLAPAVVWLAHEDAKVNGEVLGAQGRVTTLILNAESQGFQGSSDGKWTVEVVRDNWDQVMDEKSYTTLKDIYRVGALLFHRLSVGSS